MVDETLSTLAEAFGVEVAYEDVEGNLCEAGSGALLSVLACLGAEVEGRRDAGEALRKRRIERARMALEPVLVAWEGALTSVRVNVSAGSARARYGVRVELEGGGERGWSGIAHADGTRDVDGHRMATCVLSLPGPPLPLGYHSLFVDVGGALHESTVISAPREGYRRAGRPWGAFAPTYALTSDRNWGVGDLTDLGRAARWVRGLGGELLSTLPLTSSFLDSPCDPSPYVPVSRLFWNELFLDVDRLPELSHCPEASRLRASEQMRRDLAELRGMGALDYRRAMALKRRVLEPLAEAFFGVGEPDALREFEAGVPWLRDYARFRSITEREGTTWPAWPDPIGRGRLEGVDVEPARFRYHCYAQLRMHEQLAELTTGEGAGLVLDMPLGVHPHGYDTFRFRSAWLFGCSAGAPPDSFFHDGQDWGFPPVHPEGDRRDGHGYFVDSVRRQMAFASFLRLDHVMGLHRVFTIPRGYRATDGVYVRQPWEERYAIVALESLRSSTQVVGEDLGTVPQEVREAMSAHGMDRMFVVQFEIPFEGEADLRDVPRDAVASVNTHDMPTFTGFLGGADIDDRASRRWLSPEGAIEEHGERSDAVGRLAARLREGGFLTGSKEPDSAALLESVLTYLASSDAHAVLVALADLSAECVPENVPGTSVERPNWRRKLSLSLEALEARGDLAALLARVDECRRGVSR